MKLIDKKVYVIATRKTPNESWETSGANYWNLIDAQSSADGLSKLFTGEVKVFVFDRAHEIVNVDLNYKEIDR